MKTELKGSIYTRPGSANLWIAYYHNGKLIRESCKSPEDRIARTLLEKRIREIQNEREGDKPFVGPAAERVTVSEILDTLETKLRVKGRKSLATRIFQFKRIRREFGDYRLKALTEHKINQYIESRHAEGARNATINRETQILRQALRLAVSKGFLAHMPEVERLSEEGNARQGFFERADFERVVSGLPEDLQGFTQFAYLSGWRKGEVSSLRWQDVDRNERIIRLRPENSKNGQGRLLALEGELWTVIERQWGVRQYRREDGTDVLSPLVFHRGGIAVKEFRKSWASACKAANVPGMLFHDLRRTAVRNMVRAGVPERVAMSVSGHKTRAIFDRYTIVSEADIRQAVVRTQASLVASPRDQKVVKLVSK